MTSAFGSASSLANLDFLEFGIISNLWNNRESNTWNSHILFTEIDQFLPISPFDL